MSQHTSIHETTSHETKQSRRRRWAAGVGAMGLLGAAGLMSLDAVKGFNPSFAADEKPAPAAIESANDLSTAFRFAAEKVLPSVVTIRTVMGESQPLVGQHGRQLPEGVPDELKPFMERFFGDELPNFEQRRSPQQLGMGSGVIIDSAGVILTNSHVVAGGAKVVVRLHDGREFTASDVRTDPKTDIAVVRIEGAGELSAAAIGDSDAMQIGDWVLAVGAPFGLQATVTSGIISAKSRGVGIAEREDFLQTDAAINPGNSGGPLVNLQGEVVGINTAISSRGGGSDGIGFAVPVNLAQWVSGQLISTGNVQRAFLGVGIQQVTNDLSKQFGLETVHGALVTEVRPDTAAAKAGLQMGDVIIEFDGLEIGNPRELQNVVERAVIDETHNVTVMRDGERITLDVTLQTLPQTIASATADEQPAVAKSEFDSLGLQVSDLTVEVAKQLGLSKVSGVVVTSVTEGSPASAAGIREGMVISRAGDKDLKSVDDLHEAVQNADLKEGLLLLVRTSDGSRFVVVKST